MIDSKDSQSVKSACSILYSELKVLSYLHLKGNNKRLKLTRSDSSGNFWSVNFKRFLSDSKFGSLCKPFRDVILIPFRTFSLNINTFKKSLLLTRKPPLTVFSLEDVVNASQFVISPFQFDKMWCVARFSTICIISKT